MSKKPSFPMFVRHGSARVTIYRNTTKRKYDSYTVRYCRGTEEIRETRTLLDEALEVARSAAQSIANGELDVLTLRSDDRLSYVRAIEHLRPTGVSLEAAAEQYAKAHRMLGGIGLIEAVQFFARHRPRVDDKTVSEVAAELLEQKRAMGRCGEYVKDMRLRLKRFSDSFKCCVSSITTEQIEDYLLSLNVSPRTQNNHRRLIGTLFNFAAKRNYLPEGHAPVADVEVATEIPHEIEIFSPSEMRALLAAARPEMIPFIALAGFAGLRHAECKRLDWSDIHLDPGQELGHIALRAGQAKTKVRRIIPIHANLRQWLAPYAKDTGPVVSFANVSKQLMWLAEAAQVPWKHNGLRHSYVSYRVAETNNIPQVSYECGNSPRVIERNYLQRVTVSTSQQWFSIEPPSDDKIVVLPAQNVAG